MTLKEMRIFLENTGIELEAMDNIIEFLATLDKLDYMPQAPIPINEKDFESILNKYDKKRDEQKHIMYGIALMHNHLTYSLKGGKV